MATPHIAGIVALMRQANPNLTSEQIRQILLDTADDLGPDGEDNTYGRGVANALSAVNAAISLLNGWGGQEGYITDQASGDPLPGARISVIGRTWGTNARANGHYVLMVPSDTAWVVKVEFPPSHLPIYDTITVVENDTISQNYALEGKVNAVLRASFANPVNVDYRSFYIKGSWNADGFYDADWSAPLIEVKDDGVAPDQVSGDGIFTASVLLARDNTHTYSWAIYSENYGGENARLQYGSSFQIPNLIPPVVPTLAVNPSGSDNNWNISVLGDNGLNFNLNRTDLNHPTRWAAACSLTQGYTYTFRFRAMHSSVASYGVGGIGGADIVYSATTSGPFDFIFDDRNDSYIVQLTGTEGPPTYLSARSGLDGHIPISWLPPGTTASTEWYYDDGTCANGWMYLADDNVIANMFAPASWPLTIDSVMVHLFTEGDPNWPWPDGSPDPVLMSIFLDDGTGYPQADPVWTAEVTGELGAPWVSVDVPEINVDQGYFWVGMQNLAGGGQEGIGQDAYTDFPENKWGRLNGVWATQDIYTGDQMIRVKVFGGGRDLLLSHDATPAEEISSRVGFGGDPSTAVGTGQANPAPNAASAQHSRRMAYHPNQKVGNLPTIMDTEVLAGYNLYRDLTTGPFNRPLQTKVNSALITATSYDDWGTDANGPIVNGVTYFYQASAVYDIGGGRFVEVGPSNEVTGVAQNHPPANPTNLTGSSNGNNIDISWNRNTDYDIQAYRVYRRDYNQQTFNLVGTVTHPDTTFHEVITIDGIYRYKIAAVDRGGLQSDGFSNSLDLPIGAIPPRDLRASIDQEFQVSLRWNHPGGGGGELNVLIIAADACHHASERVAGLR